MNQITPRIKKLYTDEEKQHHVLNWKKSGLTMLAYSRQSGISLSSLSKWNAQDTSNPILFQPVISNRTVPKLVKPMNGLEILLPHGASIRFSNPIEFSEIIALIREMLSCN